MKKCSFFIINTLKFVVVTLIFFNHVQAEENILNAPIFEVVKWKSKSNITDETMVAAVDAMVGDLKILKGFIRQSLYKNASNEWVDIYYWRTIEDAHASNDRMADKVSFKQLIKLIEPDSVSIETLQQLQTSSEN